MIQQEKTDRFRQYDKDAGLYIGDLEDAISDEILFMALRDFGELKYMKLHRYPFIGQSKHYAFVYYSKPESAKKAKQELNYSALLKKPLRMLQIKEVDQQANIFFCGFPKDATLKEVDKYFTQWGGVMSVQFSYNENKESRGYGWVQFETKEMAQSCLDHEGPKKYGEQEIQVKSFVRKGQQGRADQRQNLYLKNFWPSLDAHPASFFEDATQVTILENEIRTAIDEAFKEYGKILSVFVKVDAKWKSPIAFVCFDKHEDARKAIDSCKHKDLFKANKSMYVNWAQSRQQRLDAREGRVSDRYVFIQNLKNDVTEKQIEEVMLENIGEVHMVRLDKIANPISGISRIGYVIFRKAADARNLILNYEDKEQVLALFNEFPIVTFLFPRVPRTPVKSKARSNSTRRGQHHIVFTPPPLPFDPMMNQPPMRYPVNPQQFVVPGYPPQPFQQMQQYQQRRYSPMKQYYGYPQQQWQQPMRQPNFGQA